MSTSSREESSVPFRTRTLERATHEVGVYLQDRLRELRLSQAEIHVLGYLAEAGPSTVNEIHASFGHRRSTLSSVLNRLDARGLVERSVNPSDRRSVVVTPTAQGAVAAAEVRSVIAELEQRVADGATAAEHRGYDAVLTAVGAATRTPG